MSKDIHLIDYAASGWLESVISRVTEEMPWCCTDNIAQPVLVHCYFMNS